MNSSEISKLMETKRDERVKAENALETVISEKLDREKSLIELNQEIRKGRYNIRRMREEEESLKRAYFRALREE